MRENRFRVYDNRLKKYMKSSNIRLNCANGNLHGYNSNGNVPEWESEQYTGADCWCENDIIRTDHFIDNKGIQQYLYHQIVWSEKYLCWYAKNTGNEDFNESDNGNIQLWVFVKNAVNPGLSGNVHGKE